MKNDETMQELKELARRLLEDAGALWSFFARSDLEEQALLSELKKTGRTICCFSLA